MTDIVLDYWNEDSRMFKKQFMDYKQREEYEQINAEVEKIIGSEPGSYSFLINYFPYARRFSKAILNTLEFNSDTKNNPILYYVSVVKKRQHMQPQFKINQEAVPEKWRKHIFGKYHFDWKYFELYVLSELANALQCGEIWVKDGKEHSSIYGHMVTDDDWKRNYKKYFEELGWDTDKEKFTLKVKRLHTKALNNFNKGVNKNIYAKIKNDKLSITPLDKNEVPQSVIALRQNIVRRIGNVDLTDILVDVQNWLSFCEYFKHAGGKVKKLSKETIERLLATLHSYGCNLGPTQTEKSTNYSKMQIINTRKFFFSEENLRDANNEIVNSYNKISISNRWGDGSSVSADGRLIRMTERNLMASWNVKYKGVGGMLYTHVSDKYIAIFSKFINCGVYEAEYALDALFNKENEIDIKPDTLHVDTHGQIEVLFGFCFLLGINLMPRIKSIGDIELYRPNDTDYKYINSLFKRKIDWSLIENYLYPIMRVIASIREGKERSSFFLKKLTTYRKSNKLFLGFRELGRVARTIYALQYAGSKELRRMVQEGCNKAELWHAFQKFVYFGQSGELRTNDLEDQRNSTTALELVCNCISYWNAYMIDSMVKQMIREKEKVRISDIDYISPLITQHINRYGRFDFDIEKKNKQNNNS